ncbi:MAG: hypothetical protein ACJ8FY_24195 [Gemmataceae bacterium]
MTTIKAIVRNGRIEVDEPIDLPDGTELTIPIPVLPAASGLKEEDGSDTPDAIENWIRWYDSLQPVAFTPEERAAWDAARREQKQSELAQWHLHSQRLEELIP